MGSESIVPTVQPGVEIIIDEIGGDLEVSGRAGLGVRADGDNPRLDIEDDGKRIRIACDGDCVLRVPEDAHLLIDSIGGDANINHVGGKIAIKSVGGDLVVRDTGPVRLGEVGGDLELKRVNGEAHIETVGGDANFKDIEGELHVDDVGGDAAMTNVESSCECEEIGGDFAFNLDFEPGTQHKFSVGGDVLGEIRGDANVQFIVPSDTETFVDLAGAQIKNDGQRRIITLGEGAATVEFEEIGGEFTLIGRGKGGEASDAAYRFSFADDIGDIISARVAEQIAPILDNVKRQTERIQREVERTAERARDRSGSRPRAWSFGWAEKPKHGMPPIPPIPPTPPAWGEKAKHEPVSSQPVSDEERMAILRMVESKQISVEEAEKLLSALEG